jgi:probable HAF family extracellular repeat protein
MRRGFILLVLVASLAGLAGCASDSTDDREVEEAAIEGGKFTEINESIRLAADPGVVDGPVGLQADPIDPSEDEEFPSEAAETVGSFVHLAADQDEVSGPWIEGEDDGRFFVALDVSPGMDEDHLVPMVKAPIIPFSDQAEGPFSSTVWVPFHGVYDERQNVFVVELDRFPTEATPIQVGIIEHESFETWARGNYIEPLVNQRFPERSAGDAELPDQPGADTGNDQTRTASFAAPKTAAFGHDDDSTFGLSTWLDGGQHSHTSNVEQALDQGWNRYQDLNQDPGIALPTGTISQADISLSDGISIPDYVYTVLDVDTGLGSSACSQAPGMYVMELPLAWTCVGDLSAQEAENTTRHELFHAIQWDNFQYQNQEFPHPISIEGTSATVEDTRAILDPGADQEPTPVTTPLLDSSMYDTTYFWSFLGHSGMNFEQFGDWFDDGLGVSDTHDPVNPFADMGEAHWEWSKEMVFEGQTDARDFAGSCTYHNGYGDTLDVQREQAASEDDRERTASSSLSPLEADVWNLTLPADDLDPYHLTISVSDSDLNMKVFSDEEAFYAEQGLTDARDFAGSCTYHDGYGVTLDDTDRNVWLVVQNPDNPGVDYQRSSAVQGLLDRWNVDMDETLIDPPGSSPISPRDVLDAWDPNIPQNIDTGPPEMSYELTFERANPSMAEQEVAFPQDESADMQIPIREASAGAGDPGLEVENPHAERIDLVEPAPGDTITTDENNELVGVGGDPPQLTYKLDEDFRTDPGHTHTDTVDVTVANEHGIEATTTLTVERNLTPVAQNDSYHERGIHYQGTSARLPVVDNDLNPVDYPGSPYADQDMEVVAVYDVPSQDTVEISDDGSELVWEGGGADTFGSTAAWGGLAGDLPLTTETRTQTQASFVYAVENLQEDAVDFDSKSSQDKAHVELRAEEETLAVDTEEIGPSRDQASLYEEVDNAREIEQAGEIEGCQGIGARGGAQVLRLEADDRETSLVRSSDGEEWQSMGEGGETIATDTDGDTVVGWQDNGEGPRAFHAGADGEPRQLTSGDSMALGAGGGDTVGFRAQPGSSSPQATAWSDGESRSLDDAEASAALGANEDGQAVGVRGFQTPPGGVTGDRIDACNGVASEMTQLLRGENVEGVVYDLGREGAEARVDTVEGLGGDTVIPTAINDRGDLAGASTLGGAENPETHAFARIDGRTHDLGTLGGGTSVATAIGDDGLVVGTSDTPEGQRAFAWRAETGTVNLDEAADLGEGWTVTKATDVTAEGTILALAATPTDEAIPIEIG